MSRLGPRTRLLLAALAGALSLARVRAWALRRVWWAAMQFYKRSVYLSRPNPALEPLRDVERLSDAVVRVLGQNPSHGTLQGTNTYLVGTKKHRVLIDTGHGRATYYPHLARVLREARAEITDVILTHWHLDHVSGVRDVLRHVSPDARVWKFARPEGEEAAQPEFSTLEDGQTFAVDGATLQVLHTPGHTMDHAAVLLLQENAVFTGDAVLGVGTAVFDHLPTYVASLRRMLELAPARLYPGHGPVVEDAVERLELYLHHRESREEQVLATLEARGALSAEQVTWAIYGPLRLSWWALFLALRNVEAHLDKLRGEGRVEFRAGWFRETWTT